MMITIMMMMIIIIILIIIITNINDPKLYRRRLETKFTDQRHLELINTGDFLSRRHFCYSHLSGIHILSQLQASSVDCQTDPQQNTMPLKIVALLSAIFHFAEASENVALGKSVSFCDERTSNLITDGDKSLVNFEMVESNCLSEPYVSVRLLEDYHVHYVVVYEGIDWNDGWSDVIILNSAVIYK